MANFVCPACPYEFTVGHYNCVRSEAVLAISKFVLRNTTCSYVMHTRSLKIIYRKNDPKQGSFFSFQRNHKTNYIHHADESITSPPPDVASFAPVNFNNGKNIFGYRCSI